MLRWRAVGCGGRDEVQSGGGGRSLIAAARAGDRAAVYARFGPRTRARIDGLLSSAQRTGGTRMLRPEDLVTVGWLPPAWEPAGMRLLRRDGTEAEVEVYSAAGDRQAIRTVRKARPGRSNYRFARSGDSSVRAPGGVGRRRAWRGRASAPRLPCRFGSSMTTSSNSDSRMRGRCRRKPRATGRGARRPGVRAGRCAGRPFAVAAVGVAPLAAQDVAQLLDGVRYLGDAHDLRGAAVAERQAAALELHQLQLVAPLLLADGARSPPPTGRVSAQRV